MPTQACTSLRYATQPGSAAVENLAALWGADPALAARVERVRPTDRITTALAKNGDATAATRLASGSSIQLHSRYDPSGEAAKLIDRASSLDGLTFFVLGFGLGYHVETLLKRIPTTARIWVIEPDLEQIRVALDVRELADLLSNPRVSFITEIDRPKLLAQFQTLSALIHAGVSVIEHAPSVQRSPAFFDQARAWLDELGSYARTAMNTLVLNATKTIGNIARNLPWYVASPGPQRLAGAYRGQPAIVVAAGPSLRKNQHLLREAQGKAVIIAVQTTLKPMLDLGIEPDFVTSLDYSDISARFFQELPSGLKTELVAEAKATDAIFGLHPGPLTLIGNELADNLLRDAIPRRARLRSGATVAHLAFYLAEYLGCDPIILVGQDLGFSDGLCYTPGTSYDDVWRPEVNRFCSMEMKQWEQIARERPILRRIPDVQGRPMYTEQRLFTYLQQFERDFAESKSRVIDASEGGALKRGTTCMPLRDALDTFCARPLRPRLPGHPGLSFGSMDAARQALSARTDEARRMRDIASQVVPLLEEIRDHLDDQSRVNRVIARIDPLREQMNQFGRTYDLVMYLAQKSEYDRFKADLSIDGSDVSPTERQRRQATRDLNNACAVVAAADAFVTLIDESCSRFDTFEAKVAGEVTA